VRPARSWSYPPAAVVWFWAALPSFEPLRQASRASIPAQLGIEPRRDGVPVLHKTPTPAWSDPGRSNRLGGPAAGSVEIGRVMGRRQERAARASGVNDQRLVIAAVEVRAQRPRTFKAVPRRKADRRPSRMDCCGGSLADRCVPRALSSGGRARRRGGDDAWGRHATFRSRLSNLPVAAQGDPAWRGLSAIFQFDLQ